MQQQICIITLGVQDIDKMGRWYEEKFGWIPRKLNNQVQFRLAGMLVTLIHEGTLAKDLCAWEDGTGFKRFMLTIGFNSEKELNKAYLKLLEKGVPILRKPEYTAGNVYRACVMDPEENCWELAYHPYQCVEMRPKSEDLTIVLS